MANEIIKQVKLPNGEVYDIGGVSSWNDLTDKPFEDIAEYVGGHINQHNSDETAHDDIRDKIKVIDDSYLSTDGGTMKGILYTEASTPLFIGKNGKVGMRAATADNVNVGQINISNAWYDNGNQWGSQISAYNGATGKYNELRVSHDGIEYRAESDTPYQVLHEGNILDYAEEKGAAQQAIQNLVNGAPEALDTLDELAAALKDNANIVTVLENAIAKKADKSEIPTIPEETDPTVPSWAKQPSKPSYTAAEVGALEKITYEYNREIDIKGVGYVCIGKFPMYDSNITVDIDSTTDTTYHGTLVIATQNINTSGGGARTATVYGDPSNTLADRVKIHYGVGSNVFSVYINLPSWSKNLLHIRCMALAGEPTDIATTVDAIPENATMVPVNAITSSTRSTTWLPHASGSVSGSNSASAVTLAKQVVTDVTVGSTTASISGGSAAAQKLTPTTDSVLGADTTFSTSTNTTTNTTTTISGSGLGTVTKKSLTASIGSVAVGANGTAKAVTGYASPTTGSFVTSVSVSPTTVVTKVTPTTGSALTGLGTASTATAITALNTSSVNSVSSNSNVSAVNASVSGEVLVLTGVTASKIGHTAVTVATGSAKSTATVVTGYASPSTGTFVTGVTGSTSTVSVTAPTGTALTGLGTASTDTFLKGVKVTTQPTITLGLADPSTNDIDVVTNVATATLSASSSSTSSSSSTTTAGTNDRVAALTGVTASASTVTGSVSIPTVTPTKETVGGTAAAQSWSGSISVNITE